MANRICAGCGKVETEESGRFILYWHCPECHSVSYCSTLCMAAAPKSHDGIGAIIEEDVDGDFEPNDADLEDMGIEDAGELWNNTDEDTTDEEAGNNADIEDSDDPANKDDFSLFFFDNSLLFNCGNSDGNIIVDDSSSDSETSPWTPLQRKKTKEAAVGVDGYETEAPPDLSDLLQLIKGKMKSTDLANAPKIMNDYLHNLLKPEIYKQLVDCFRLHVADEYQRTSQTSENTPSHNFLKMLDMAQAAIGVSPAWWNQDVRESCVVMARNRRAYPNIFANVDEATIVEDYGDPMMPMMLRLLAEKIYAEEV